MNFSDVEALRQRWYQAEILPARPQYAPIEELQQCDSEVFTVCPGEHNVHSSPRQKTPPFRIADRHHPAKCVLKKQNEYRS